MYNSEAVGKSNQATILDFFFISCNTVSFPKQDTKLKCVLRICEWEKVGLRTVPAIVTAHTFCASPDTRISYRQCLLIQGYFCAV